MGGLFGGGKTTSTTDQMLANIQLQTSSYGGCLPIIYGTTRVASNLIDYDDFTSIPHTTSQQVGKGGGGSTQTSTTYTYTAGVIMALCEGPIAGINQVWRDKDIGSLAGFGFTLLTGTRPQSPWATWTSKHPAKALGYSGMALVCQAAIDLGTSGTMKNHSFEVTGFLGTEQDPAALSAYDAKPASVVVDFLTNVYYGATWSAGKISDLVTGAASYATYCTACGFAISPLFDAQKPAAEHIQDIMDATNAEAIWTAGATGMTLKVVPYGDTPITANGTTYTPNTTPLYDLTYDDFLGVVGKDGKPTGNDAITVNRSSTQDVKNTIPIEYWDRLNAYNVNVLQDPDAADVSINGAKVDGAISMHMITRAAHALQISRIKAQRNVYVRNTYTFQIGWKYLLLEPMDLVTLTDPKLGLDHKIVRIVSIDIPEETSEEDGLTIVAEEWPFGTGSATLYTTQNSGGTVPNVNVAPGNAVAPVIFEPPAYMAASKGPEIWLGTSGTPNLWGGCEVWVSSDGGSSYKMVGSISLPARFGVTTAILPSGSDPDTTNTLAVDLTSSYGTLNGTDVNGRDAFATACLVENEIVSFQTPTLTAANKYNLTSLRRGAYGSSIGSHALGVKFMRLDDAVFKMPYDKSLQGKTLYIKLVSFNAWGGGKQDISTLTPYTFVPAGVSYPQPTSVTLQIGTTPFI